MVQYEILNNRLEMNSLARMKADICAEQTIKYE